ncbi:MAG: SnoaL-like domain-containing protein [Phycisphaerae bacterium]
MTTAEVAQKLTSLCQAGKFDEAMETTYANNIVSLEAFDMPAKDGRPAMPRETRGLDNVRRKAQWWNENHTIHSCKVAGPYVAADKFAVTFDLDVTFKPANKRIQMSEVALYTVENGKIIHEEFLYRQ